jgi:tyrosyl-tRNA synthetase
MNVIDVLDERGFIDQTTHDQELKAYVAGESVSAYIGFDPTASSLHIGNLVPIMALANLQRCGHRPIALVGGGTGLVGDPSGKTEMRQMLTPAIVDENAAGIKEQLSNFIDFSDGRAIMVNNADWLLSLEYIPFLRDIGRYFSVNRMIKAESYRMRLDSEEGLSFIEFNYQVLQAYDFLKLFDQYGCRLQMGGSDQWGNIVAGIDLIRRVRGESSFGATFPLITTSGGAKMGKTAQGAVWLDRERTSPYDYYQYWINTDDRDVRRFLALYTFLPMDEIRRTESLTGVDLNAAKTVLAFEATRLAHGADAADQAHRAAASMFGERRIKADILPSSQAHDATGGLAEDSVPSSTMPMARIKEGVALFKLFQETGLAASGGAARRLIEQGGAYVNGRRLESLDDRLSDKDLKKGELLLRAGKKRYHRILFEKTS